MEKRLRQKNICFHENRSWVASVIDQQDNHIADSSVEIQYPHRQAMTTNVEGYRCRNGLGDLHQRERHRRYY